MTTKRNFHTHSTWCDGKCTPAEMAASAVARGFVALGFSSHAMFPSDPFPWPLTAEKASGYAAEVRSLAAEYAGRMEILVGVEADYVRGKCSPDRATYGSIAPKYVIGSVHYVVAPDGKMVCVDESPESLEAGIKAHYDGNVKAYLGDYFAQQREMALSCDFDVIGHPDLCRKFNGRLHYFNENDSWYVEELERTADAFAASGKIVEVNTGAISRGWMDDAYPSRPFRDLLRKRGVRFLLSSDAHAADAIDCAFDRFGSEEDYLPSPKMPQ